MRPFQHLLFFAPPQLPTAQNLASTIAKALHAQYGCQATVAMVHQYDETMLPEGVDCLVAAGGDGTMLRVARLAAQWKLPIVGINLGQVGFLVEIDPQCWKDSFAQLLRGDYWLEERLLVAAQHRRAGISLRTFHALNEIVVTRGALARPVRLETAIDDVTLTTYLADGLIVATPTGSTAYALAAGGPILPPDLQNLVLVPIAAHFSMDRALVLSRNSRVSVRVHTFHQAILSADGQVEIPLQDGDEVTIAASDRTVQFIHLADKAYFYRNLTARLVAKGQS